MTAAALHKGNVCWEMSGWGPRYFPESIKRAMAGRPQHKIKFASGHPGIPSGRFLREWDEMGDPEALMEKIFHSNAERRTPPWPLSRSAFNFRVTGFVSCYFATPPNLFESLDKSEILTGLVRILNP